MRLLPVSKMRLPQNTQGIWFRLYERASGEFAQLRVPACSAKQLTRIEVLRFLWILIPTIRAQHPPPGRGSETWHIAICHGTKHQLSFGAALGVPGAFHRGD